MSTVPPASRPRLPDRSGPSMTKQYVVLVMGTAAAGLMAFSGTRIATEPIWLLGLIPPLPLVFLGLLATTAWLSHSAVSGRPRSAVGPVHYLACTTFVAGLVLVTGSGVKWVGVGLLSVTALAVVVLLILAVVRPRRRAAAAAVRTRSVKVTGVVTDDGLARFAQTPSPKLATITVRFVDAAGVPRWVTPKAFQLRSRPIAVDDEVTVWFDPADPGDLSRIVVEKDNGSSHVIGGRR
ncbi:hypothetical protein [Nocardia sp. NPDC006630]|uniref:hypothetical protein n=1 Tax=Nocardia sp. NPDC006630 TaxID=3157181 RepID=UPI0033A4D111